MPWGEDKNGGKDKGPWGQAPDNDEGNAKKPENDELDELIKKGQEKISSIFSKSGGPGGGGKGPVQNKTAFAAALVIIAVFWLLSGIYTVNTKEEGVVLRFGKYARTAGPGLKYHLPYPIENVTKIKVTDRYRTEVGYQASKSFRRRGRTNQSRDLLMLTGDENIVDVNFEVQWQIDDARKFLFNVDNPQKTVRDSAESAMREVIGTTPLNDILSEGRTLAQQSTKQLLQEILDSYDIGIRVEEINMKAVPPRNSIVVESIAATENGEITTETITTTVDEAFKDVQAAIINKEEIINTAIARSNEVIPEARGHAQKLLQEAEGYKQQAIAKSEGEAKRFISVYNEYKKARNVTKKRIYLETMEKIMAGMDKIILDSKNGVVPYLPVNEFNKKR